MMTVRDIAAVLGAAVEGDAATGIGRVAKIEEAVHGDISFLANPKYAKYLDTTLASAVIIGKTVEAPGRTGPSRPVFLRVDDPYTSFLKVLLLFSPPEDPLAPGIHPTAVVDPGVKLGTDVRIGPHAVVGERCRIGDRTMIMAGTVIGRDVTVGAGTLLYANVTVREGWGIVVVGDDVEIGANCTVDRATMGETRIENGVKLDNLIQVAHNVVIGEHTVIAAQSGISGSTKIGKRNMIGGQVGFSGHLAIADDSKWGAQSGVHRSVPAPGGTYMGTPAVPFRQATRIMGGMPQLPDALVTIRELKSEVEALRKEVENLKSRS